jgi:hypothetical protein
MEEEEKVFLLVALWRSLLFFTQRRRDTEEEDARGLRKKAPLHSPLKGLGRAREALPLREKIC